MQAIAERHARPNAKRFDRPGRTCLFASFPSTSYRATFTESLRDKSSVYNPKLLKLALRGLPLPAENSHINGYSGRLVGG
jgi:hypothetical protein